MMTESELLDIFDIDEVDDKTHPCMLVMRSTKPKGISLDNAWYVNAYLDDEGIGAYAKDYVNGTVVVIADLTIEQMLRVCNHFSTIRTVEPNHPVVMNATL